MTSCRLATSRPLMLTSRSYFFLIGSLMGFCSILYTFLNFVDFRGRKLFLEKMYIFLCMQGFCPLCEDISRSWKFTG